MTRTLLAMSLLLLLSHSARAQQEESPSILAYACDQNTGWFELKLGEAPIKVPGGYSSAKTETIDTGELVTVTKEDKQGNVYRTGSKTLIRTCGMLTVKISDGYYTSNPNGGNGYDDFAIIEIFKGKRSLTGRIAMGTCDASLSWTNTIAQCPENWATKIESFLAETGSMDEIQISHTYEETR